MFEDAVHRAEVNFAQNAPDSRCLTIKGAEPYSETLYFNV